MQTLTVNKFNWDEGEKSILDLFGTSSQHPEDHFVQCFCDTEHTTIEEVAHVVHQGKIRQKVTILLEEDCLVLFLPDVEMRICQVK